ncbi:MAG TPA: hypothetical protein PKK33_10120, partial [Candidatus Cloacimonadota bacterium]|nr:hypothetical protein [Candidatus Cloacimonadota bacterium]
MDTIRIVLFLLSLLPVCLLSLEAELPSIIADSDSLDLSYWTTQQNFEDSWDLLQDAEPVKKIQVNEKLSSGWRRSDEQVMLSDKTVISYDNVNIGFCSEKRYGGKLREMDFSIYTGMRDVGAIRNMLIGDYRMRWGEGLILGRLMNAKGLSAVGRDPQSDAGYLRGASMQTNYRNLGVTAFSGMHPLYAKFNEGKFDRLSSYSTDTQYQYFEDGLQLSGVAMQYSLPTCAAGFLAMRQEFSHEFSDSLFSRGSDIGSIIYSYQPGFMRLSGETSLSGKRMATVNSVQWGRDGFRQTISYCRYSAYFPDWMRNGGLRKPETYRSDIMQYQLAIAFMKCMSLNTSFSYERRDVLDVNRISKQFLKCRYEGGRDEIQLLLQFRQQSSANVIDSTGLREDLPWQMTRIEWMRKINSSWTTNISYQDKQYRTNKNA